MPPNSLHSFGPIDQWEIATLASGKTVGQTGRGRGFKSRWVHFSVKNGGLEALLPRGPFIFVENQWATKSYFEVLVRSIIVTVQYTLLPLDIFGKGN